MGRKATLNHQAQQQMPLFNWFRASGRSRDHSVRVIRPFRVFSTFGTHSLLLTLNSTRNERKTACSSSQAKAHPQTPPYKSCFLRSKRYGEHGCCWPVFSTRWKSGRETSLSWPVSAFRFLRRSVINPPSWFSIIFCAKMHSSEKQFLKAPVMRAN